MAKRAAALYAERKEPPHHSFYVLESRQPDEMEQARILVRAAAREVGAVLVESAALALVGVRWAWIWVRQWRRVR